MNKIAASGPGGGIINPLVNVSSGSDSTTFFPELITNVITLLLIGGVLIFFFYFIFGAIKWISSGGDKGKVESARGTIAQALIGLVILFSTFAIVELIGNIFGVNILSFDLTSLFLGQ